MGEAGFAGIDATTWFGMVAPAKTPRDIVMKLNEGLARALAQPELRVRLAALACC